MRFSLRLPGGTLKIKSYRMMRGVERDRRVPMVSIGPVRFIWWSNADLERYSRGML
jgi:hypothetical protein